MEHIGGGRPGEELSNVALVTYRGPRDKGQGRSRTNILKSSSDYPEVCSCVAIFTQGAVCMGTCAVHSSLVQRLRQWKRNYTIRGLFCFVGFFLPPPPFF